MKRKASALTLIMALLFSAVAGTQLVFLAGANPYYPGFFPLEPVVTHPTISVESPVQNQGYDSSDVWLNFTITKPETWFVYDVAHDVNGKSMSLAIGRITSVYYILDDGEPQNITVDDGGLPSEFSIDVFPTIILNFSTRLSLTGGKHSVKVGYEANTYYYSGWDVYDPGLRSVEMNGSSSEDINFTIAEPLLTTLVAAASVATVVLVSAGLLVYFRKRRG